VSLPLKLQDGRGKLKGNYAFSHQTGSPRGAKIRTVLSVAIVATLRHQSTQRSRLAYEFVTNQSDPDTASPLIQAISPNSRRQYRNPIFLARKWQSMILEGTHASPANLARHLGVSRARVSQVLRLLELNPEALEVLTNLGDPLPSAKITERKLRTIVTLPLECQMRELRQVLG
jgi:hypothetical protein